MTEPKITVTYAGGYAPHLRAGLLSYVCYEGAIHQRLDAAEYPYPICPVCTLYADDIETGVAWPCSEAASCA